MKGKKILSVLLVLAMMMTAMLQIPINKQAKAAEIGNASYYVLGSDWYGMIDGGEENAQYYYFSLPSSGRINISGLMNFEKIYLKVYDKNIEEIWSGDEYWNSTSEVISLSREIYLTSGTYYLKIERDSWNSGGNGSFNFRIDFTSTNESFMETTGGNNNSLATASEIWTNGTQYSGQIAQNDEKDFYKFTLDQSGKVSFNATFFKIYRIYWKLYDENGNELLSEDPYWNDTTENIVVSRDLFLTKGVYYLSVSLDWNYFGKYQFSLSKTSSNETYSEGNGGSNNTTSAASSLSLENTYIGQIAFNDEKDFYVFYLPSKKAVNYQVNAEEMEYIGVKLYDGSGNELWSESPHWNNTNEKIVWSKNEKLEAGTYYLAIEKRYSNYGNYNLKIAGITQSNCNHDYESSWHDATYFSKGYRLYKCKWCGHSYKSDYENKKQLPQGYFYTYDSYAMKKKVYLNWSTTGDASGYQIRYSRDKSMQSGVKYKKVSGSYSNSKTISGLGRKKNWYFQVRPYKTSGGQTAYGKWSSKLKLKTK